MAASKLSAEQLITDNIDVWTSAIKKRGSQGRGSSKKIELYGIKKLRKLILDLAMRGLLVPQDSNDEPASALLKRIVAEKERLVENNEIKKQKPVIPINNVEKIFELANGWKWVRLGEISRLMSGKGFKKSDYSDSGARLFQIANVSLGYTKWDVKNFMPLSYCDEYPELKLSDGDVLIALNRPLLNKEMKVCILEEQDLPAILYQRVGKFDFYGKTIDTKYFYYYMQSGLFIDHLHDNLQGSDQPFINQSQLVNFLFPLPSNKEQGRIVAKVNELMALCDQLEQQTESSLTAHQTLVETLLNTLLTAAQTTGTKESSSQSNSNLESSFDQAWNRIAQHFDVLFTTEHSIDQLKQTILQLAVMGKLVPQDPNDEPASVLLEKIAAEKEQLLSNKGQDKKIKKQKALPPIGEDEKPFELPGGWEWTRFGELFKELKYGTSQKSDYHIEGCPVLRIPNVVKGVVDSTDLKFSDLLEKEISQYSLEAGDFLQIRSNGSSSIVGTGAIVDKAHEGFAYAGYLVRVRFVPDTYNSYFLLRVIQSQLIRQQIERPLRTTSGVKNINSTEISNLYMPCVPLAEQARIVAKIDELMALCESLKSYIREFQITQTHLADAMAEQALS